MTYGSQHHQTKRLDPEVERQARHSDMPDGSIYGRPSTARTTDANLDLSIIVYVVAGAVALISIFWLLH